MTSSINIERVDDNVFSHWIWILVFLLTAAVLSFFQADAFPPSVDEFATMYSAGWLGGREMHASEILQSLVQSNIANLPGYNLLLGAWGNLIAYDIAVARILGIYLYLLILAQVYRLARDLIAPIAGLFAVVILMSNAFFNFYIADARPYTLFVLLSCVTVWLYLRIIHWRNVPTKGDYISLGAAMFALVMTHLFSITLLLSLAIYHLFVLRRNRRWLWTGIVMAIAVILCLPLIGLVLTQYSVAQSHLEGKALSAIDAISAWLRLMLNDRAAILLVISVAGLYIGKTKARLQLQPWLALLPLFLITLALVSQSTTLIRAATMRHQLDGWILLILFAAAGQYALYRWRPWLVILLASWILAGLAFQTSTNWWNHIVVRAVTYTQPPVHEISRLATNAKFKPNLVGYPYDTFFAHAFDQKGYTSGFFEISMSQHYFSQFGMNAGVTNDIGEFSQLVGRMALYSPSIWHFHSDSDNHSELAAANATMSNFNYRLCAETYVGLHTIINHYMWNLLDCQPLRDTTRYHTELIEHEFYKAGLNIAGDAVMFIDKWTPRREFDTTRYNMSYQLIDEDWSSVAQLDLPLVSQGEVRQFSIDVSDLPSGTYRLMLIMYNAISGDRLAWEDNADFVPEMLPLDQVSIDGASLEAPK